MSTIFVGSVMRTCRRPSQLGLLTADLPSWEKGCRGSWSPYLNIQPVFPTSSMEFFLNCNGDSKEEQEVYRPRGAREGSRIYAAIEEWAYTLGADLPLWLF